MSHKKFIITAIIICAVLASGCASPEIKHETAAQKPAVKSAIKPGLPGKHDPRLDFDYDTVVVRGKWMPKLERMKREATRKNNGDSVVVMAGTIGAVAAYTASSLYYGARKQNPNPVATFLITGAAAYTAGAIAGFIYDHTAGH
jgi:hypothetical protein